MQEVAKLERQSLRPETLGLTLSEAKALLQEVQQAMVTHQSAEHVTRAACLPGLRPDPLAERKALARLQDAFRHGAPREPSAVPLRALPN